MLLSLFACALLSSSMPSTDRLSRYTRLFQTQAYLFRAFVSWCPPCGSCLLLCGSWRSRKTWWIMRSSSSSCSWWLRPSLDWSTKDSEPSSSWVSERGWAEAVYCLIMSHKLFWRSNLLIFQLILELCKGSARGSVDLQVIQSYLERLPITSANTDVSTLKARTFENSWEDIIVIQIWIIITWIIFVAVQRCRGENNRVHFHCTCGEPAERPSWESIFFPGQTDSNKFSV